jgi:hypothetical protein
MLLVKPGMKPPTAHPERNSVDVREHLAMYERLLPLFR